MLLQKKISDAEMAFFKERFRELLDSIFSLMTLAKQNVLKTKY